MDIAEIKETLKDHGKRIGCLEVKDATMSEKIEGLISQMKSLMGWIKALVVMFGASFVGFFFYAIQTHLFGGK